MKRLGSGPQVALMEAVVEARKLAGLTQRQLVDRLQRTNSFVWRMEVGARGVQVIELIELGWATGVRPDSFIDRIVLGQPLVGFKEERIRIPLAPRLREFMHERLVAETVTARKATGKSQRQVGEEIGHSETYIHKLEKGIRGLEVLEYLALSKVEDFKPAQVVAKVARATIAKVVRGG